MVKCPECGEEIEWLVWIHEIVSSVELSFGGKILTHEHLAEDYDSEDSELICPHCEKVVAASLKEAKEFLKGKIVVER